MPEPGARSNAVEGLLSASHMLQCTPVATLLSARHILLCPGPLPRTACSIDPSGLCLHLLPKRNRCAFIGVSSGKPLQSMAPAQARAPWCAQAVQRYGRILELIINGCTHPDPSQRKPPRTTMERMLLLWRKLPEVDARWRRPAW